MSVLNERASGVLMHISSLPSKFGIGTFGKNAYSFADLLKDAGAKYWQILPLGHTSFGDSPYQSFSTYAGNPYFIDLDILCEQGFLEKNDYEGIFWGEDERCVDFGTLYHNRKTVFLKAKEHFYKSIPEDFEHFCRENAFWLEDYALFMAIKDSRNGASLDVWDEDLRKREPEALENAKKELCEGIKYYKMLQFFFSRQLASLKNYVNSLGIKIIGDLPIYVSSDSADVWANPGQFDLDENLRPNFVAGCPPDAFSENGQLWGNPVYDWNYIEKDDYRFWISRLKKSFEFYDVVRIDHFRGFEAFYNIPYGAENARGGHWKKGPGMKLFDKIKSELTDAEIIAEDLGFLTEEVYSLLRESGFPGMKVLQFAFSPDGNSDYMPARHPKNSVVYTGTHDNDTLIGFSKNANPAEIEFAKKTLGVYSEERLPEAMMKLCLASNSNTAILTMQDLIGLDSDARMNTPATDSKNWRWRALDSEITKESFALLKKYNKLLDR